MAAQVGTPTIKGMKGSLTDFAYGAGGGLAYSLITSLTGSGLIGGLIGAGVAGSVIKGDRGTMIATILGFQAIVSGTQPAAAAAPDAGVM